MKIGELASASSTAIETIRYYEREGLLPAPARSEGNFRLYQEAHLERLHGLLWGQGSGGSRGALVRPRRGGWVLSPWG